MQRIAICLAPVHYLHLSASYTQNKHLWNLWHCNVTTRWHRVVFHTRYITTHICWRCTQKWGQILFEQLVNFVEKPLFKEKKNQYWGKTLVIFHHDSSLRITEITFTCCHHFEGQVQKTHFQCKMLWGLWEFPAYLFSDHQFCSNLSEFSAKLMIWENLSWKFPKVMTSCLLNPLIFVLQGLTGHSMAFRADFRFAPSQWEMLILCNDVSHWLGENLESALALVQ